MTRALVRIGEFLRMESAAGIILIFAAAFALIASNSPFAAGYASIFETYFTVGFGDGAISKPILLWINDLLMAIFFLLVGLEIKREIMEGALSSVSKATLPVLAAVGGMLGPMLVFLAINQNSPETLSGWAIPAATDIAFALGILLLLGHRAPVELKILLLAIAIIDDLGAITIIALFYTANLDLEPLFYALACLGALIGLNRSRIGSLWPYILVGAVLWVLVLKSGVHATLAGVVTAAFIPLRTPNSSPLHRLEHGLHPWVAFGILPIFALANAGVALSGLQWSALLTPLTLGLAAGLVVGKQVGVFGAIWLAVKTGLARKPEAVSWGQLYGLACLTGVGFTMSLFIGGLAFADPALMTDVRIGVLTGSLISALSGIAALVLAAKKPARNSDKNEALGDAA
ncbi:MAG: Na+/H+ antiporter NhaA [Maricaulis sp.]|uniref:Na+/H+ antiporter NhaA n=1 Tax=Maricaulis sp. TaxID=1486257 RepID=UPI001B1C0DBB|nr:Na+/H+ antiporter NhaA [Maricaulis sp.]MBO6730039.1 Na+/H+ antiporter NhaA [Maricaulis sp.]MBO6848661.1 Na+/H+ antiporter NhaA [Maricaulis sp.]MBO6878504.1 Na+/H+ antiporter NhaA [Maricaulis sp.]MDM7985380.1 Na+/H+ antiporter NhaA [Maricaulis sp.]